MNELSYHRDTTSNPHALLLDACKKLSAMELVLTVDAIEILPTRPGHLAVHVSVSVTTELNLDLVAAEMLPITCSHTGS